MRVRFLETVIFETEGVGKGPTFEKDSIHDFREDIARRWISRKKAEEVGEQLSTPAPLESKGRSKLRLAAGQGE